MTNKRIIAIIGKDEKQKQEYLAKLEGYEIYYNPENNRHPNIQRNIIEVIICDANIYHKQICIATNSPYVLTTLNNLLYAGRLKDKISEEKFVEIMGNVSNYILPNELEVINLDTNKSIIENDEILTEEIDVISNDINEQYSDLYYLEEKLKRHIMFKVGDFVYCNWGFNGGYYGRIMSVDPKSTTPYEVKIYYHGTGQKKKDHNRFFTNDVRLAQDVIADEINLYQNKIDMLRKMNTIETTKDLETK